MHLDTYEQVANAVNAGRNVVCRVSNQRERIECGREIMNSAHHRWEFNRSNPNILRSGAGMVHIFIQTDEVRGMKYHDSIGWIGDEVSARVRLT